MEYRLGLLAYSREELTGKLESYVKGEAQIAGLYQGHSRASENLNILSHCEEVRETLVASCIASGKYNQLVDLWAQGLEVDWSKLWGEQKPRRTSLPGYPFARERYWVETETEESRDKGGKAAVLHPLLQRVAELTKIRGSDGHRLDGRAGLRAWRRAVCGARSRALALFLHFDRFARGWGSGRRRGRRFVFAGSNGRMRSAAQSIADSRR